VRGHQLTLSHSVTFTLSIATLYTTLASFDSTLKPSSTCLYPPSSFVPISPKLAWKSE
jgi:hypothetical protein